MPSKVYFTRTLTSEKVVELYKALGISLPGKVAVKLHSGEEGNQNFLGPDFWKPMIEAVSGTVVECNTAYEGSRNTTKKHLATLEKHGWSKHFHVDLLDAQGPDMVLDIPDGHKIHKNYVGKDMANYDSMLVLSHFKGHPMGGFGGALKQLSIGCASGHGKTYIHGAGDPAQMWTADQDSFLESMADADQSVMDFMGRENIVYINVANRLSVDCDCDSNPHDPEMADIGIFASLDPVAVDQACVDAVYHSPDEGKAALIERMESRHGIHTVEAAAELGLGSREYTLVNLD